MKTESTAKNQDVLKDRGQVNRVQMAERQSGRAITVRGSVVQKGYRVQAYIRLQAA